MLSFVRLSRPAASGAAAVAIAFGATGCTGACEGAECGDLYPRASLGRFDAAALAGPTVDPRASDATLAGADADGFDWAIVGLDDGALVGVPAAREVRRHGFGSGATELLLTGAADDTRFGGALALGAAPDGGARLVVGAPEAASGPLRSAGGLVYVYEAADASLTGLSIARVVRGAQAGDRLGERVWACGDLDGDGAPDWAAGSSWLDGADGAPRMAGGVYLGLSASLPLESSVGADSLPVRLAGVDAGAGFGAAALCDRSLDGDGLAELVLGAPYADALVDGASRDAVGSVDVHAGGTAIAEPAFTLRYGETGGWFGAALAVGDLDGDGFDELVVGAPGVDAPDPEALDRDPLDGDTGGIGAARSGAEDVTGAVYVYDGAALRAHLVAPRIAPRPNPARALHGTFAQGRFGAALAVGDLDGDGVADLVVGAPGHNTTGTEDATRAGAATVWWGPYTSWPTRQLASEAPVTLAADRQYLETGRVLAVAAGDATDALLVLVREPASDTTGE